MGLCEGVTFPAVTSMMARWAPASERSRMTFLVMAGGQVYLSIIFKFFLNLNLQYNLYEKSQLYFY